MNNQVKTGVEWLPTLPNDWKIEKVKRIFYISKELSHKNNPTILSLARSGIKVRNISNNEGQLAESYDNYNFVKVGDLLLNPMDLYSGANCNVSYVEGVISPAYSNLRAKTKLEPKFFDFYFKVQYWTMAMFAHGKGVSFDNRWTLNADSLMNYEVPVPSFEEQKKIVFLLNRKIQQIDELISNQERQIEKLKEYKQSLINQSVFNGKKYFIPLKKCCLINKESLKNTNNPLQPIEYAEIGDVTLEDGIKKTESFLFKNAPSRARRKTKMGDIIVSTVRTYLKAIAIVDQKGLIVSTGFAVLEPINVSAKYLGYALKTDYFTSSVSANSNGINYPSITSESLINLKIPTCDKETQEKISAFLDDKCNKINKLIKIKNQKIENLKDYKKSLIYEYVTGEKRVSL